MARPRISDRKMIHPAIRMTLLATIILSLTLLPGCHGSSALIGDWTLSGLTTDIGLRLMANGRAESFQISAGGQTLGGTLTWEVNGSEFTLRQEQNLASYIYLGRLSGTTSVSGYFMAWDGAGIGDNGFWSAVKQ